MRADLNDLAAFVAVARELSFRRAAAGLRLSTSALSYTIKKLETRLDVRLLQRTSRSVSLTEAGEQLLRTLGPALGEIDGALDRLARQRTQVSGTVRITATQHALRTIVQPVLPAFCATHPDVTVEVLVDFGFRDVVADRFDAGIRMGEKVEQDMIAVRVGPDLRMAVVASPAYFDACPAPMEPHDLTAHRCFNYRMQSSGGIYDWEFERDGRQIRTKVTGPLTFNSQEPMLDAALQGLGVAYLVEDQAEPFLRDGRLVRVLDDWTPRFPGYFLYYPSRRQMSPALAALIAALRRQDA